MEYLLENQETDRIRFRRAKSSDFSDWLEFFKTPETSKFWISDKEAPEISCKKWYRNQFYRYENNLGGMNALVGKDTGVLMGHCGLLVQEVDDVLAGLEFHIVKWHLQNKTFHSVCQLAEPVGRLVSTVKYFKPSIYINQKRTCK